MTVSKLLISGACERKNGFKLGDGKYYGKAVLLQLDLRTGECLEVLTKTEGGENYPVNHPNLQFTAGCIDGDILWLPTDTEIYKLRLPEFENLGVISHPQFQNIHSVHRFGDQLVATSTGLDCVIFMDASNGRITDIRQAEGRDPWYRFNRDIDYRHVHSTRPHECHPNYVFELDDSFWVTRCTQEDAVDIFDTTKVMDISRVDEIAVHDGVTWRDKVVFTRVDSTLALFDANTREFLKNIRPFASHKSTPVGWCRGLCIDGNIFYFAISKLRKTRVKDRLKYLLGVEREMDHSNGSQIVAYDMDSDKIKKIYRLPTGMIDAIYGLLPFNYSGEIISSRNL